MKRLLLTLMGLALFSSAYTQDMTLNVNAVPVANGAIGVGVAYALNDRYTVDLSGAVRPWARGENSVNKYWGVKPEFRYWFCQKFNGSFLGVYGLGSQYNIGGVNMPFNMFPDVEKYRFEGWTVGGGVSYGYQLVLNDHWNLEGSIGVGYSYYDYTQYRCPLLCARVLKDDNYHYWGINTASLAIVYLF